MAIPPGNLNNAPREWDAGSYDAVPQPQERWGAKVLEIIRLAGGETVLEAGAGTGRDAALLLKRLPSGRVIALDGSHRMLDQLRGRLVDDLARVHAVKADLRQPLPVRRVDAVFSVATFHWIPDHDALFRNIAAVLPKGGQLAADCGGEGNIDRVKKALGPLWRGEPEGPWHFTNPADTYRRLLAAGFVDVDVKIRDDPARLEPGEELEQFLRTVVLGWHLGQLPAEEHDGFVRAVAARLPGGEIDYVRLTIDARRGT